MKIPLEVFAEIINRDIVMRRHAGQGGSWSATLDRADVMGQGALTSAYGNGDSPAEAMRDYVSQIAGKTIVFDALNEARRQEFKVPEDLVCSAH